MKKCPYCAEEIQDEAIKCRHCFEFLDETKRPTPPPLPGNRDAPVPWYFKTSFIVLMFLTLPPLALPSVWMHPKWPLVMKLLFTAGVLAFCWFSFLAIRGYIRYFQELLQMLNHLPI